MKFIVASLAVILGVLTLGVVNQTSPAQKDERPPTTITLAKTEYVARRGAKLERAIVAGGCFWGTEYYLRQMNGVVASASGYLGGKNDNPTYKEVCFEATGHAEAVMVEFDPAVVPYSAILERFWQIHNPCTWNRQGPDIGTQYRSVIFYMSEEQRITAEASKKSAQKNFKRPIVTLIEKATRFWMAEEYHQQYAEKTGKTACPIDRSDHKDGG